MFDRLRNLMGARAAVLAVVLVLVGGSVALAIPDQAVDGQATASENHEAALSKLGELDAFLEDLHEWLSCIQEGARAYADQQSNSETRVEAGYDVAATFDLCGGPPWNHSEGGEGAGIGRPEDAGPPAEVGRPDDVGPPAHAGADN